MQVSSAQDGFLEQRSNSNYKGVKKNIYIRKSGNPIDSVKNQITTV